MSGTEASRDSSLGQLFKDARERRGLTLRQVSSDTKIPLRHLEALERDDLDGLPPGPYLRGQIRACAQVVHLDTDLALNRLDRLLEVESDVDVQPPPAPAPAPRRRRLVPAATALVVCVALAAVWAWRQRPAPVSPEPRVTAPEPQPASLDNHSPSEATGTTLEAATPVEPSPAAPSPPTTSDAQLVVTTDPPGARVTVNGIGWGTSPITIRHLPAGDKNVRVSLDGYLTGERGLSLSEGETEKVSIRLRPAK